MHLCNIEALLPSTATASPFREVTAFRHFPTRYVSYTNGKSIGRLDEPSLRAHGPHHFRSDRATAGWGSSITFPVPPDVACVLHYESATYQKWHQKCAATLYRLTLPSHPTVSPSPSCPLTAR